MDLYFIGLLRKTGWLRFRLRLLPRRDRLLIISDILLIRSLSFNAKRVTVKDNYLLNFGCVALANVSTYTSALGSVAVLPSLRPAGYATEVK